MADDSRSTFELQHCIDRLRAGDERARDELLNHAAGRLMALTRRMSKDFRRLNRWEQTEDVCQNASVRLWNALKMSNPQTVREFYRLAALQIRRELIDLVRRHFGPEGMGANHASNQEDDPSGSTPPQAYDRLDSTLEPGRLAAWAEFHQRIDDLPDDAREAFDLLWYQGLTQAEAADLLGISEPTVKRRWRAARVWLCQVFEGEPPG